MAKPIFSQLTSLTMRTISIFLSKAFILLCIGFALNLNAQVSLFDKGDKFYKSGAYSQAIPFYEEGLKEKKNIAVQTKLAYCYKIMNKMEKAVALYAQIVPQEQARPETYYYYAEALMFTANYDEAKVWLEKYLGTKPDDEKAKTMLDACTKVKSIAPIFKNVLIKEFPHNTEFDDNAAVFAENGLVFCSDRTTKKKLLKTKSGTTGREFLNLYYSKMSNDTTFGEAALYANKLNELNKNTGSATFTADSTTVFFARNSNVPSKNNAYNLQLYKATAQAKDGKWKDVQILPFCTAELNYMHPAVSPDGSKLFFVSDKSGGEGGTDIYVSYKTSKGWSRPENLGAKVNTSANEGFPFIDGEGKLYFASKGHIGFGGFDIFLTVQNDLGEWQKPQNIGYPINSSADDFAFYLEKNAQKGLFTSSRSGGDDDIFLFYLSEKEKNNGLSVDSSSHGSSFKSKRIAQEYLVTNNNAAFNTKMLSYAIQSNYNNAEFISNLAKKYKSDSKIAQQVEVRAVQNLEMQQVETKLTAKGIDPIFFETLLSPPKLRNLEDLTRMLVSKQMDLSTAFLIENAKFSPESDAIIPTTAQSLDMLVALMKRFPKLKIEILAHTDSRGDDIQNYKLSSSRAANAVEYLVLKGLEPNRLDFKGLGETDLINHCKSESDCSEEEHQINQRLEVKVLSY